MHLTPERRPLPLAAADLLKRQIAAGVWHAYIPPERDLCARMEIGRNTLRAALALLEREGWIGRGHPGRRRAVNPKRATVSPGAAESSHQVAFLTDQAQDALPLHTLREVDMLRVALGEAGYRLVVRSSQAFPAKGPSGILTRLVRCHPAAVWILHRSSFDTQQWFQIRGIQALVLGCPHEGIDLPYVTENIEAAARHAAGLLFTAGHRSVALLCPGTRLAGHHVAARSVEGVFSRLSPSSTVRASSHDGSADGLCLQIRTLLAGDDPPTAFITMSVAETVTLVTFLAQLGRRVPDDASVLCLFDDPTFSQIVPAITRYRANTAHLVRLVHRRALEIAEGLPHPPPSKLMCECIRGRSVAPPPPRP